MLELQNTLEDLSSKVDNVKEENLRLRSENQVNLQSLSKISALEIMFMTVFQVLGQYIENLMTASQVFQTTEQPRYK